VFTLTHVIRHPIDDLLATLPAQERNKVLKAIGDPNTWKNIVEKTVPKQFQFDSGKALMGIEGIVNTPKATVTLGEPEIVNSLAPQQQNQNALAR